MEVDEAMWEAAGEKFYEQLPKDCGLSDEKYDKIKDLLENWDQYSAGQRREMSGGNHVFWSKKYRVVGDRLCYKQGVDGGDEGGVEDALGIQQVSYCEQMFDDIISGYYLLTLVYTAGRALGKHRTQRPRQRHTPADKTTPTYQVPWSDDNVRAD